MCTSPLYIRNKSYGVSREIRSKDGDVYSISNPYSRKRISIPCGKCPECLQQKRDGYFIRCLHEFHACKERAFFVTLTYDKLHLPLYEHCDPATNSEYVVSMWYKPHVQKYLKSVNDTLVLRLAKKHGITRSVAGKLTHEWCEFIKKIGRVIKYLVVCERGSNRSYIDDYGKLRQATQRPHYHAIIFLTHPELDFKEVDELIHSRWIYGNVDNLVIESDSNNDEYERSPIGAIDYVTKYVTKDGNGTAYHVDDKELTPDQIIPLNSPDRNKFCPFVLLSQNLGISLLDMGTDKILNEVVPNGLYVRKSDSDKGRRVNLPMYYIRKIFYDNHVSYERKYTYSDSPTLADGNPFESNEFPSMQIEKHIYFIPNQLGERYLINSLHEKATNICDTLRLIKEHPSIFIHTYNLSFSRLCALGYDCNSAIDILLSTDEDELYQYIVDRHGFDVDDCDMFLDICYELLRAYNNTKKIAKRLKREADYKANLPNAIMAKPKLFKTKNYE